MTPARPSSPGTRNAWLVWFALVLGCVAYFIGFRDGWLPREPLGFAGLVALALLVTATLLAWDLRLWIRHGGRHLGPGAPGERRPVDQRLSGPAPRAVDAQPKTRHNAMSNR